MAQILRPIATTISTRIASGDHTDIDEPGSGNDNNYIQTLSLTSGSPTAQYECLLALPPRLYPSRNGDGTATIRWRAIKTTADGGYCTARLVQGATVLASGENTSLGSISVGEYDDVIDISGVTDWSDLRLRFDFQRLSGSPAIRLTQAMLRDVPEPGPDFLTMFEDSF